VHDGVRPVDELELAIAPVGALGALVLAVADGARRTRQGLPRRLGVEVELDHLPVALVQVVPVVERVEEPVLQCQLARRVRLGHDVRVGNGLVALGDAPRPLLVATARVESIAGEVEVVVVETLREIGRRGPDLHEVAAAPGAAQRDRCVAEEGVDVHRAVRLPRAALPVLRDEADDRRVALRERGLVGEAGRCRRGGRHGDQHQRERARERDASGHQPRGRGAGMVTALSEIMGSFASGDRRALA
jgi:hypothetical protein